MRLDLRHLTLVSALRPGYSFRLSINTYYQTLSRDHIWGNIAHSRSLQGETSNEQAITGEVRVTKENCRDRTPSRQKPSALLVPEVRAPSPRIAGPRSCLHCATFPKVGPGLDVTNSCSDLQTSPLLNSTDSLSFPAVRQLRVPC